MYRKLFLLLVFLPLFGNAQLQDPYYQSYVHPDNNFTEFLSGMPHDHTIGNPCGVPNYIDVYYEGDFDIEAITYLQNARLTIYGQNFSEVILLCDEAELVIEDETLSNQEVTEVEISMYPNPASNYVNVKGNGLSSLQIITMTGQIVLTVDDLQNGVNKIHFYNLQSGTYLVALVGEYGQVETKKLIVK